MTESEWMNKIRADRFPWMNDDQWECYLMLCELYGGDHHVFGIVREGGRTGININTRQTGSMATFDFCMLTRAVLLAHDRMIRFSIEPNYCRAIAKERDTYRELCGELLKTLRITESWLEGWASAANELAQTRSATSKAEAILGENNAT